MEKFKEHVLALHGTWDRKVQQSADGVAELDMANEFLYLMQKFMLYMLLGVDKDETTVTDGVLIKA